MKKLLILCAFFMPFFVSAANTPQVNNFANSSRIYRRQFSLTLNPSNTDCYEGLVCETGICRSPKQSCRDAGSGAQPTCDCTFDEWAILDLTSGGNMVRSAFTSAGIISANGSPNDPFFGLEGYVVALNLKDLMTSGEKYTKLNKLNMTEKEKELSADEKFYTKENRKIYNDAYKDYFRKKGYKENEDFFVTDDKVFLINDEKQMENLQ